MTWTKLGWISGWIKMLPVCLFNTKVNPSARHHDAYLVGGPGPPLWKIWLRQLGWGQQPNISGKMPNWWQPNHQLVIFPCCWRYPWWYPIIFPRVVGCSYPHSQIVEKAPMHQGLLRPLWYMDVSENWAAPNPLVINHTTMKMLI